jgi:hypothetical protein
MIIELVLRVRTERKRKTIYVLMLEQRLMFLVWTHKIAGYHRYYIMIQ